MAYLLVYYDFLFEELLKPVRGCALVEATHLDERLVVPRRYAFEPKIGSKQNGRNVFVKITPPIVTCFGESADHLRLRKAPDLIVHIVSIPDKRVLVACCGEAMTGKRALWLEIPTGNHRIRLDEAGIGKAGEEIVQALEKSPEIILWSVPPAKRRLSKPRPPCWA